MIDQRAPPPALDGVAISEARSSPMGAPSTESGRNLALGILLIVAAFLCVAVVLIIKPRPSLLANPSSLIALLAAVFSAIALVTVNTLSRTDRPDTILFYYFLIASLATAPFAVLQWKTPEPAQWGLLIGVGVFMALAQLLIILAYEHATASQIAPFNYSVVLFSVVIGWIVWHDVLDWIAVLGILLVCAGGICSVVLARPRQIGHGFRLSHGHGGQRLPDAVPSKPSGRSPPPACSGRHPSCQSLPTA